MLQIQLVYLNIIWWYHKIKASFSSIIYIDNIDFGKDFSQSRCWKEIKFYLIFINSQM